MKLKFKKRKDIFVKEKVATAGITLISLVITIIVLLILAGISIATLTGENGILTKAKTAKKLTEEAEIKEQIELAVVYSKMNNNTEFDKALLESELKNNLGTEITITKNGTNEGLPWEITKGDYRFEIAEDGTVTKKEASIIVSNLIVKNGETVLEENINSVDIGTLLTISFDASIEEGTITSIEPNLPYTPADSNSVKLSETFIITGTNKDGNTITKEYTVNLKGYYNIPDLKVGDYITGYTLKDTTSTEVQAEITGLNDEINSLSGYETTQTLSQASNVQWRVLEIDETTGQPTKLISADRVDNVLYLKGAMGYNNAVYLLNKACEVLYSGKQGTARSIKIEDLEEHYSTTGKETKANYLIETMKYGEQKRFEGGYSYYPQIAKEENGIGVDTEIYTAEDGNIYNILNNSGIEGSEKGNAPYVGTETKGSAYDQASTNGITMTQTYYDLSAASSLSACYENDVYYKLFHRVSGDYWIASRCVLFTPVNGYFSFYVRYAYGKVNGLSLFRSYKDSVERYCGIRPIINLKSNIQAEYVGASSTTGYNTWNIQ